MKKWTNKKKIIVGVVTLVCVGVVAGGATAVSEKNKTAAKIEQKQKEYMEVLDNVNTELKAALDKEDEHYLVQGFTQEDMDSFVEQKNTANAIDGNEAVKSAITTVNDTFEKVQTAFNRQEAVNSLYKRDEQTQAMDGKELKNDLAITDDLKKEFVMNIKDAHFVNDAKNEYDKTINSFITNAAEQVEQIEIAEVAVSKIYNSTEEKVSSVDQTHYDSAKSEVDKIKNDKAKNDLLEKISKVKEEIDKQAAAKKEQEKLEEQATKTQAEVEAMPENQKAEVATAVVSGSGQAAAPVQNGGTANASTGQVAQPAAGGNSNSNWNQGSGGGQTATPPASGSGNTNAGGGSTGGGVPTAPAGTVGPFYSYDECYAHADSQGWLGFAVTIIDGAMFISPR